MSRWEPFDVSDSHPDPFVQFATWYAEGSPLLPEPQAVSLSTASREGRVSSRMVLLRHVGDGTFGWYTNYDSHKGHDLEENPQAALLWWCEPLGRQIRIEGHVAPPPTSPMLTSRVVAAVTKSAPTPAGRAASCRRARN